MSGIPEDPNEITENIVVELAGAVSEDIDLSEIERSHHVGKPRAWLPRDIIIKFSAYRTRQRLYKYRTLLKDRGHKGVYINEDLTKHRNYLLNGPVARKPVFGVSDKESFKPVSSATETS